MAQHLNNAPASGDHAAPKNVPRVHVYTAKDHPMGSDIPVYSDLVIQAMSALTPDVVKSNKWTKLQLTFDLGLPLKLATTKVPDTRATNSFAEVMSIRRDAGLKNGWRPGVKPFEGPIMIIRDDEYPLQPQDIEAIAEFVGTKLPHIEYCATWAEGHLTDQGEVAAMAKKWKVVGNKEAFAKWWFEWKDRKVAEGYNEYAGLQCPVPGAVRPKASKSKKLKEAASGMMEQGCVVQ